MNLNNVLYEADETAWLDEMVRRLKAKDYVDLDFESLVDFLESAANRDRREVRSRLSNLMKLILLEESRPTGRSDSRQSAIGILEEQDELSILVESKTLRQHACIVLDDAYQLAVRRAALETRKKIGDFSSTCPFKLETLLSEQIVPKFDEDEGL